MASIAIRRTLLKYQQSSNNTSYLVLQQIRQYGMRKTQPKTLDPSIKINPNYNLHSIPPPDDYDEFVHTEEPRPEALNRKTPTSAYAVDIQTQKLCQRDAAWVNNKGVVVHGRYGELSDDIVTGVPLEYLPLLRCSADGAAAVRELTSSHKKGTMIVFGASEPSGLAALQLASKSGLAVVGVVGGEHSGNDEMVDYVKGLTAEPGFVVPEEYALVKKNFQDLVHMTTQQKETSETTKVDDFLSDFQQNIADYSTKYPPDRPALHQKHFEFKGVDHERKFFVDNWEAYYEQFEPGSPPMSLEELQRNFTPEKYMKFKELFSTQAAKVYAETDDLTPFYPANAVKEMCGLANAPEEEGMYTDEDGKYYNFNIQDPYSNNSSSIEPLPILGAIITATPSLLAACTALSSISSLRGKAEALQGLHFAQRNAYAAASSCVALAKANNAPVYVIGNVELPGLPQPLVPQEEDVKAALEAMQKDDNLRFFVQVYRACDWPIYEEYAVHRASEPLAGPRQVIVAK